MSVRLLAVTAVLVAFSARAVPFTITITNNATTGGNWSTGLITLSPLIGVGPSPQPSDAGVYATYEFADSNCNANCGNGCSDNGNAAVLAQRLGLTLGTNAWQVNALAINGGTQTLTIDAPVGSTLSYIAWINDVNDFDDFVAMHVPGNTSAMAVPLFSGNQPLSAVDFIISGYDANSVDPNDGNADTCVNQCPASQTDAGCFVAPGNASYGSGGIIGQPTPGAKVTNVTAVSGNGQVRLAWTNQAPHTGVVIARRSGSAVTWTPTNGTTYTSGQVPVAGTTIAYSSNGSDVARTDTGLNTNGTRYFYKVFAYGNGNGYANGDVPSTAGIFSDPTPQTGANPRWCYSVGMPSLQQPTTQLNTAVYTASNTGAMTANQTAPGSSDGWEVWRPTSLSAAVQVRASLVPLAGRSGEWLLTADQGGFAYLVSAADGTIAWTSANLGTLIQAQPVAQLNAYANTAFKTARPGIDLIYVGTHNTASHTNNSVVALSSVTGAAVWTYTPGQLDWVTGMAVDYTNNRLYVAAYSNGGAQGSLRVLNSITGAVISSFSPGGDLTMGVNLRAPHSVFSEVVASSSNKSVYAISLPLDGGVPAQLWSVNVGSAPSAYAFPLSDGFIAPLSNNTLARWTVTEPTDGGAITSASKWSVALTGPSGVSVDYTNNWLYVGSTDGHLRQLNLDTGATMNSFYVTDGGAVGMPTLDTTANRVHVGTADGRLCAFPNPLQ